LFAVSPHNFPVLLLRELRCQLAEFPLQRRGILSSNGRNSANYPVFSREAGKYEVETGSPMTASTANICGVRIENKD
jgi:hypothetical protein